MTEDQMTATQGALIQRARQDAIIERMAQAIYETLYDDETGWPERLSDVWLAETFRLAARNALTVLEALR